jgi:hypothetical protein
MNFVKILAWSMFIAILPLPYGYYIFLRPLICLGMIYLLIRDWGYLDQNTKAISIVIAVLFNPFSAIFLNKIIWIPIDLACGYFLLKKYQPQILRKDS